MAVASQRAVWRLRAFPLILILPLVLPGCQAQGPQPDVRVHTPPGLAERFLAPPGIEWGFFQNADHARIRYSHLRPGSRRATLVIQHGHREFGEKYFELMREFAARGYEVWQMDWRGYGGSDRYLADPEKAHSLGPDRDARDLEQFVRDIIRPAPGAPLFLVAHSMGANLATRYLHDYPGRFRAAVLCSPFLSLAPSAGPAMPEWVAHAVIWSTNSFGFGRSWALGSGPWLDKPLERLSHDPARSDLQRQWNRSSPVLRIGGVTNAWVHEFLGSFDLMNRPHYYSSIRTAVLMGSASEDVLTKPEVQAWACSQMANCRLVSLEHAWHELFMESDHTRLRWMDAVFAFLEGQQPR